MSGDSQLVDASPPDGEGKGQGYAQAQIAKGNGRGSGYERNKDDWYVEPPWVVHGLLDMEPFGDAVIWDPTCGRGTIPHVAEMRGHRTYASDRVDRGYPGTVIADCLMHPPMDGHSIICNPPYAGLQAFVDRALAISTGHVAVLARLAFLEGTGRRRWFADTGLSRVLVSSGRVSCPPGHLAPSLGSRERWPTGGAVAYAWFVWRPGHAGDPTIGFIRAPGDKP